MSEKKIIKLSQNPFSVGDVDVDVDVDVSDVSDVSDVDAATFESSLPAQHGHCYYADEALGLYIGVCDTTDIVKIAAPHAYDEFMTIIEGAVAIKNNNTGKVETIMAGESFVIPYGYDCQWHQQGYYLNPALRKFYVIYEPQEPPEKPVTENVIYINENSDIPWQATSDGHKKKVLYQNHNQSFTCGVWQGNAFTTDTIAFPYNEFITIKQGSLICTDENNIKHQFNAGDALFIPQGTRCAWQVKDKVTIYYSQIKSAY